MATIHRPVSVYVQAEAEGKYIIILIVEKSGRLVVNVGKLRHFLCFTVCLFCVFYLLEFGTPSLELG